MLEVDVVGCLSELAETKAFNAKSKGGRAKNSTLLR